MNRYLFVLIAIISSSLAAQIHSIKWMNAAQTLDSNFKPITVLQIDNGGWDEQLLPFMEHEYGGNVTQVRVNARTTSLLSSAEKNQVHTTLQNDFKTRISQAYLNNKLISFIRVTPVRQTAGGFEKLESYSLEITTAPEPPRESRTLIKRSSSAAVGSARTTGFGTSSALSSGSWYKVAVSADGLYKMDYSFFQSIGINPSSIDPRTIKIFGNGGGMLPQKNSAARVDDIIENRIFFSGENDGSFDNGDYLLFYAEGPHTWSYKTSDQIFVHSKNIYSEQAYYFITFGGSFGLRVEDIANGAGATDRIRNFRDRKFHESDVYNILNSGREWYGEIFDGSTLSRDFTFSFPDLVSNSNIKITSGILGRSTSGSQSFTIRLNSVTAGTQSISNVSSGAYDPKGVNIRNIYTLNSNAISSNPSLTLSYTFNRTSAGATAHINYIEINADRALRLNGNYTAFRSPLDMSNTLTEYVVKNVDASCVIWNVSTPYDAGNQLYDLQVDSAVFTASSDTIEEYIVFKGSDFPAPSFSGTVANQNLHGINAPNLPDMVIVTHPSFRNEAQRLANYRETQGLDVFVTTTQEVYNEFSSGAQDITAIRDFMKMLYDRKAGTDSIRYLLLFGDASFDYKDRIADNTNFVPGYQAVQSLKPLESYPSDDYYGFLDNNEGQWDEPGVDDHKMEIGIGRLVVSSADQASGVVDKLIHYSSSSANLGKWRNRILFVADDGDVNQHQIDAEDLANKVDTAFTKYNAYKIYLDANVQVASPGGEKSPVTKQKIDIEVEKGALILNYTGHGGEGGWAQEAILDWNQIESWNNYNNLPFMITATCEFGSYDNPAKPSGGELAINRNGGGAIGLITSSRIVYQIYNKAINREIFNALLKKVNGNYQNLGDIIRTAKNKSLSGVYNRNYILFGDPSMILNYPKENIVITKIKNQTVDASPDTLSALGVVSIEGELRNASDVLMSTFNGSLNITVFDKATMLSTYGTESLPLSYKSRTNYIFEGKATVSNGTWNITFVVPKDISYQFDFGRISLYAQASSGQTDANGVYSNVVIGGTSSTAVNDDKPPLITLFMNDESFVNGGLTNTDAMFIAKLSDENGINVAGTGIGHELTGELNNTQNVIVMNDFYSANLDDYKNGYVRYPLKDLTSGPQTIKFKAWDTYNNSSESQLDFVVANNEKSAIDHVLNYPNPFSTYTEFHFDHNKTGDELDVMVQIFTVSGKLIKTLQAKNYSASSHFSGLSWDGRDDFGDKIGKGVYVYKVSMRCPRDGSNAYKFEKLVLLY